MVFLKINLTFLIISAIVLMFMPISDESLALDVKPTITSKLQNEYPPDADRKSFLRHGLAYAPGGLIGNNIAISTGSADSIYPNVAYNSQ